VEPILIPDATAEPEAYVTALLETLGDRDPLEVYASTVVAVERACADLDERAWFTPLGSGEWSAHQVVGHLLDVDIVYGFRWRLSLTADTPSYPGYDERKFALLPKGPPATVLAGFAGLRRANLALLQSLSADDFQRRGVHGEQGSENVSRMVAKVAGHDIAHVNQLERTVKAACSGAQARQTVMTRPRGWHSPAGFGQFKEVEMTATSTSDRMTEERLSGFFEAWNKHDVERAVAFFTPDGMYLASWGPDDDGTVFRGIEEVRRGVQAFLERYPDGHYADAKVLIAGDRGVATWTFSGTSAVDGPIRYRGADVFEFAGDRIRVKDAFRKERATPLGS
jgi:hypothetical protein